jgi:hypothetical protein
VQGVVAVLVVPAELAVVERLEFVVLGVFCREHEAVAGPEPDKLRRPRVAPSQLTCVECGASFVGRKDRLLCGARRCKDRRYARLHPEELRAKERRKYERRTKRTGERS